MDFSLKKRIKQFGISKKIRVRKSLNKYVYQYRLSQNDVTQCEHSEKKKRDIVYQWGVEHPEKYTELNSTIDSIFIRLACSDDRVRTDMLFCYAAYGFTPNEYLVYGFKERSSEERKAFISDRESVVIGYRLNDLDAMGIFNDKVQTYQIFGKYFKRSALCIEGEKDRSAFLAFAIRNPVFVKKEAKEACGRGVELVDLKKRNITADEYFDSLLFNGKIIVEEMIVQADIMKQFNDSSVNTVRCTTLNSNGNIEILFCFFRTGRKGSFVDNGGAGGLLVGVDEKTGMLNTDAVDEINCRFSEHPDTHVVFKGFQIPEWGQMIEVCKEIASIVTDVKMVGWDMAYTDNGWVVVEGNAITEMIGPQGTSGMSFRNKMREVLKV